MANGIVGVPFRFSNSDTGATKFGQSFIVEQNGLSLIAWNQPINVTTSLGTERYRVGVFANTNVGGLDQPGAFLGDSNEITIDTSDIWRRVTFSSPLSLGSKGDRVWVLNWCNTAHVAWYTFADGPVQQTYVENPGGVYPNWDNPATPVNGGTANCNNVFVAGYGEFTQTTSMPSYYATTSLPLDGNGAIQTATQVTWTEQFQDMKAGELVVVYMQQRGTATHSVGITGGQTWSSFTIITGTSISVRVFYCTYNGTWGANPRFDFTAGTCTTVVIEAYRPGGGITSTWAVDITQAAGTFVAGSSPFTKTITGVSPANSNNVTIALWATADDNTWSYGSGTDWFNSGIWWQYRNTSGTDQSITIAHKIQAAAGSTGNVSKDQLSLGGDAGVTAIFSFYEVLPNTASSKNLTLLGVG